MHAVSHVQLPIQLVMRFPIVMVKVFNLHGWLWQLRKNNSTAYIGRRYKLAYIVVVQ